MKKKDMVMVDIGKLSQGLNTTFRGVAEIFEAIGAEEKPGFGVVEEAAAAEEAVKDEAVNSRASDDEAVCRDDGAVTGGGDTDAAGAVTGAAADAATEEETTGSGGSAGAKDSAQSASLTVDDLMKVAAAKIKMNPKNSDKIGALVKAYGKKTLKDIPADRMESFMTDLSQI